MTNIGRDAFLFKRLLTGLVAAGSGAAIYFGYKKWLNRPKADEKTADVSANQKQSTEENPPEESKTEEDGAEDVAKFDPTPVLQPESLLSTNSSTNHDPESLSVSGTFEKVSLSTFQDRPHDAEDPALHSPSESFEKVSLPTSNNDNLGLQSTVPSGSSNVMTASLTEDASIQKPKSHSSVLPTVKHEPIKPETETAVKSASSIQYSKPLGLTAGSKVTQSSDPEPTSKDPPKAESQSGSDQSADDTGTCGDDNAADDDGDDKDDTKDEDDADEEGVEDDEDEDEEESSSDASADSQVKDD